MRNPAGEQAAIPTFRDPGGTLVHDGDRVLRFLTAEGYAQTGRFLQSPLARSLEDEGLIVPSKDLTAEIAAHLEKVQLADPLRTFEALIAHPRIPFISYPFEWSPEQIHDAAALTIGLAIRAAENGFQLKDATPYNIVFQGSKPVFVDIPSFEPRDPLCCSWSAAGQFSRMFLLPLMAAKLGGLSPDTVYLSHRDGLEPAEIASTPGLRKFFRRGYFQIVALPGMLEARSNRKSGQPSWSIKMENAEKAEYVLLGILRSFQRQLRAVAPRKAKRTRWTAYHAQTPSYSPEQFAAKREHVRKMLDSVSPARVLDIGCNEGLFSKMAAEAGAEVVAFDQDAQIIGTLYRQCRDEGIRVLPLIMNLAWPSPALGWTNAEASSFLSRAHGHFDFVIALAVLHHLLVTDGVPLAHVLQTLAGITSRHMLLEYVDPADDHFRRLLHGRDSLHAYLTKDYFETAIQAHFEVENIFEVKAGLRWIYLLRKCH